MSDEVEDEIRREPERFELPGDVEPEPGKVRMWDADYQLIWSGTKEQLALEAGRVTRSHAAWISFDPFEEGAAREVWPT